MAERDKTHSRRDFFRKTFADLGKYAADTVQKKLENVGVNAAKEENYAPLDAREASAQVRLTGLIDRKHFRPPGALGESEFLEMCSRCHKCIEVCPEDCIFPADSARRKEQTTAPDISSTPIMLPNQTACSMCGDCMDACPSGALLPTPPEFIRIGIAAIKARSCIAYGEDHCSLCYDACPTAPKAIEFAEDFHGCSPQIVHDLCTGCGACVPACPTEQKSVEIYPRPMALDYEQ